MGEQARGSEMKEESQADIILHTEFSFELYGYRKTNDSLQYEAWRKGPVYLSL